MFELRCSVTTVSFFLTQFTIFVFFRVMFIYRAKFNLHLYNIFFFRNSYFNAICDVILSPFTIIKIRKYYLSFNWYLIMVKGIFITSRSVSKYVYVQKKYPSMIQILFAASASTNK